MSQTLDSAAQMKSESAPGMRLQSLPRTRAANVSGQPRTYVRPRQGWQAPQLKELWRSRELLGMFAVRDIRVRYRQTFFGLAWALVVPIVQMVIFTVFFGHALGVSHRVDEAAGRALPYPLFALTGQLAWNFFKTSLDGASTSLLVHAHILRKVYIPRLVLPLAALGRPALDAAIAFGLLLGVVAYYVGNGHDGVAVSPALLAAPVFLVAAAVAGLAIGLIVAALSVSYRDLQHVLPFFTSILFFVTPVIYSVDLLPERLAWMIYLNPVVGFVEAHRAAVMGLPFDWLGLTLSAGLSLLLLVGGVFYFARVERQFADVA